MQAKWDPWSLANVMGGTWMLLRVIVSLALIGSGIATATMAQAQTQAPPAFPVTVANPLARKITQWDEYSGRFASVQAVEVRPRVSGFIEQLHFKDGQIVKAGDLLFTIDKRTYEIAVESAEADVERYKSQVDLQVAEVDRITPLAKSGVATKREMDQRSTNLAAARAQLLSAEAALKQAKLNLEWTEVKAPISGRISDRKVDVGNLVTGGTSGTTLLTDIASLDPIYFEFEVSESDFLRYSRLFLSGERASSREKSNPVRIKLADETGWPHEGKMDFVDNKLNVGTGTLRGRAIVANPKQLLQPGLFGRLELFGGEFDVLLIPDTAVISDQARKIVFTVGDDGIVKAAAVELGQLDEGLRVVRSGLKPTDRVVIDGLANPMVRPGAKVSPQPGKIETVKGN